MWGLGVGEGANPVGVKHVVGDHHDALSIRDFVCKGCHLTEAVSERG
jgi:hypothetical protein